ncbi:nitrous oxide reductase accessory protein NosL [Sulfurimonas microaerophilic]|uniref:nitrous oxide reductase accessory protein NosL n=1 Tax=Sulfurimonas microaerophilic TaxID=3058392 RepID=UPI002714A6BE|nr:nitrous oxide reductase accessory protein NosL [Sulfurimonas sp. hsl 1-7]
MLKNIILALFLIGFAGCSQKSEMTHKAHPKPKAMFQSVSEKDAVLVQEGKEKYHCHLCGMNLVKFYKTGYIAEDANRKYQYCSIHCLADHLNQGVELKNPQVINVTTLKPIPVLEAYYVVGSNVRGTMSRVSKYGFSTLEAAKQFQKKHGGEIMDFNGALKEAQKDFQ